MLINNLHNTLVTKQTHTDTQNAYKNVNVILLITIDKKVLNTFECYADTKGSVKAVRSSLVQKLKKPASVTKHYCENTC